MPHNSKLPTSVPRLPSAKHRVRREDGQRCAAEVAARRDGEEAGGAGCMAEATGGFKGGTGIEAERSGGGTTKRCVSESKKKYVAAKQEWKCGYCSGILDEKSHTDKTAATQTPQQKALWLPIKIAFEKEGNLAEAGGNTNTNRDF